MLLLAPLALALAPQSAPSFRVTADEPRIALAVLRNGDFELPVAPERGPLPWWEVLRGDPTLGRDERGAFLALSQGDTVQQPLAVWAAAADAVEFSLVTSGLVAVTPFDGRGGTAGDVPLAGALGVPREFRFTSGDLERGLGRAVVPRLTLQLRCDGPAATVDDVGALATFPAPSPADLRAEVVATLEWSFGEFLERALDDVGPRATAFVARDFEADTGAPIGAPFPAVTYHPLWGQLLDAWRAEPRADWEAALTRFVEDFLELGLHPESGLPRYWDPVRDVPLDERGIEIRVHLEFLLDLAEFGPEPLRERALGAARRIGERVLESGVLPDGSVCPRYVPATAEALPGTVPIRRLDVPAACARLGALIGDVRYRELAIEAVEELRFDHYWPGTWDRIDPGFDDNFGHYGERAVAMWAAWPEVESFRQLALSGLERYDPLWRDALRHGGNIAADQVRCWHIAAEIAHLAPERAGAIAARLAEAVHVHFTGQQVPGGHWIDVTVVGHDPQRLPVGDTGGVPQNLLEGLGLCLDPLLTGASMGDLEPEALRARFTAVLRTSLEVFGGPHGLIATASRASGAGATNSSVGSLRLHPGLVELLRHLPRD